MVNNYLKLLITAAFCVIFSTFAQPVAAHSDDLPAGFELSTVASGFAGPTDFAFVPDGRIFVLEKGGTIRVIKNGTTLATPLMTLPVSSNTEQGLLGIALDPAFGSNGYMYLYYTNNSPLQNRVSRFTVSGDTASLPSEKVLLHSEQELGPVHHSGTLRFGPDGKLWISVGNNFHTGAEGNSQDLSNIHGKILRINKDGTIPSDNPFVGQTGRKGEIWAYGFRNPFRFNFIGNKPIVGDVGEGTWEEINIVEKGGNYGWPNQEGACSGCGYINPFYAYRHPATPPKDAAVTGGFVYKKPASGGFPTEYDGSYFYGDYAANGYKGFIHRIVRDTAGNFVSDESIDEEAGNVVELLQGPDGSIYYLDVVAGSIKKLSYTTGNIPPTVKISADPTAGIAPLSVHFSSDGSSDPEGKPITYLWNFGDNTTSTEANPTHIYTQNGTYTAALTVSDGEQQSSVISFPITVGVQPPIVTIATPAANMKYIAGQTISYAATATDPQDGDLPASAFSWTFIFHHGTHTHPFLGPITGVKSGTITLPDTGEPSADTSYEIRVTVKNSRNVSATAGEFILPKVVNLTVTSLPETNLAFTFDGIPQQTPFTVASVVGFKHSIDMTSPQTVGANNYDFSFWSQGGSKSQIIATPATNTTYTANMNKTGSGKGHIHFRVREFDENGKWTGKFLNGITAKLTDTTGTTVYATQTSKTVNGNDGWVYFDYQQAGTYGVITYSPGFTGYWKQTDCQTGGSTNNVTINNTNTGKYIGVLQSPVGITANQISWCKDVGFKHADTGNLYMRVKIVENDPADPPGQNYLPTSSLNGATVKLMDTKGTTMIQTLTTAKDPQGSDGWALFKGVPAGKYGLLAYKDGYKGAWKQIGCVSYAVGAEATIKNDHTNGTTAAWNNDVDVPGGTTTYCKDLGIVGYGHIHYRVREIDSAGNWTGKFLNGITAKLTDLATNTVVATTVSETKNGQDGWVYFDNVEGGYYNTVTYKAGYEGAWKQTDCAGGGTSENATIQNAVTENTVAALQQNHHVIDQNIVWCSDVGLTKRTTVGKGNIHLRVRDFDKNGTFSGKFINGATAKLTDTNGNIVYSSTSSAVIDAQDGWVYFDNVPSDKKYAVLVYKAGYKGLWRQTDCTSGGTTTGATVSNSTTEGLTAAWQNDLTVTANQTTWCADVGLQSSVTTARIGLRIREVETNGTFGGKFINNATVKLTDQAGTSVKQTQTSGVINGQDGWVFFDNVPSGSYGIMAYKDQYNGKWRQTDCDTGGTTTGATIQNSNTEGKTAGWQPNVVVTTGVTWCADIGLTPGTPSPATGRVQLRIREFSTKGETGKFLNNATVKLTDQAGTSVVAIATSSAKNNEDGWVAFENVPVGDYGVLSFKDDYTGVWKEEDCTPPGSFSNATIQNTHTDGKIAAFDNLVPVSANQTTWCQDLGLKNSAPAGGRLAVRMREMDSAGAWKGTFINGATVKLTDTSGNTVIQTIQSETRNGSEDGWAFFDDIPAGTYGVLSYKTGFAGVWKQTDCSTGGTTTDATIQNGNTESNTAAWNNNVSISNDATTWCKDMGLKSNNASPATTTATTPVSTESAQ